MQHILFNILLVWIVIALFGLLVTMVDFMLSTQSDNIDYRRFKKKLTKKFVNFLFKFFKIKK